MCMNKDSLQRKWLSGVKKNSALDSWDQSLLRKQVKTNNKIEQQ